MIKTLWIDGEIYVLKIVMSQDMKKFWTFDIKWKSG